MVSSLLSSVTGTLEAVGGDWADISVGGITFRVHVPGSSVEQLGETGERVRLFTSLLVREDNLTLFGFITEEHREAFEALLGINGVGPRLALSMLTQFTPGLLAEAVNSGDTDAFIRVPGVGKKTASRIMLELKGKLVGDWAVDPASRSDGEVIEALTALGYSASEARQAVSSLPTAKFMSLEDKVMQALQHMGSR